MSNSTSAAIRASRIFATKSYDKMDAYQLLGQSAVIKVANVVDPQYSVACAVDKKYLPKR